MRVAELRALEREHGSRGYSRLRKAELIALLQNNPPPQAAPRTRLQGPTRPPPPPPQVKAIQVQSATFRPDRPRQPSPQGMNIFKQQEMSKS